MEKKEYKLFLLLKKLETEIQMNSETIVKFETDFNNFEICDYCLLAPKSIKSIEYYYCCCFKNCKFLDEKWLIESIQNQKRNDFKKYEIKLDI